jgi:hypothetical protein
VTFGAQKSRIRELRRWCEMDLRQFKNFYRKKRTLADNTGELIVLKKFDLLTESSSSHESVSLVISEQS